MLSYLLKWRQEPTQVWDKFTIPQKKRKKLLLQEIWIRLLNESFPDASLFEKLTN
jgi:hypothetical protein